MPWNEIIAGIALTLLVVVAIEVAELGARLANAELRYSDRLVVEAPQSAKDRIGGLVIAIVSIWFFALPWVAKAAQPATALVLFMAMLVVAVALLRPVKHASVRYPVATAAPLMAVAFATAMT